MKTTLPNSKTQHFAGKVSLAVFALLLLGTAQLFAGVKPAYKTKTARAAKHLAAKGGISAPTISYSSPKVYKAGSAISSLTPTSSGVASLAYNAPVEFATGIGDPFGIAVDAAGNVYVGQTYASTVSKIPAGGGTPISIGSGFNGPQGVAVDAAGNVYVADVGSNSVKKILAGGSSTVVIGSGFSSPTGVAVDAAGNVYVADYGNNAVKEIPVGSSVPVMLASGFNGPYDVAIDNGGNVYLTDYGNSAVKKIPAGGGKPVVVASGLNTPEGIAVDGAGNVYFVSHTGAVVQMIPAGSSTPTTIASGFSLPVGVAVDASGNVYVADTFNGDVQKVEPAGGYFISPLLPAGLSFNTATGVISGTPVAGSPATNYTVTAYNSSGSGTATLNITVNALTISYASPQVYTAGTAIATLTPTSSGVAATGGKNTIAVASGFNAPAGTAIDAGGNLYVADKGNNEVKKIPAGGGTPVVIGSGFSSPAGVAVDGAGNVYVADAGNNAVKKIPFGGGSVVAIGTGFSNPQGVSVDGSGDVYVADAGNHAVKEIMAAGGNVITLSIQFNTPSGVAVDPNGNVFVTDPTSNEIYKIPFGGGPLNGIFVAGTLEGVAVDVSGNLYVTSHGTNSVYMVVAGNTAPVLISTAFSFPFGIAADAAGNVYATDQTANVVNKITQAGGYFISIALPNGLIFNSSTGKITGTPIVYSPAVNYTVNAYNSYGSNSAIVNIKSALPPLPTLSYVSPKTFGINTLIAAVKPTSANVDAPAYFGGTYTVSSGFNGPLGVAIDKAGNIYEVQFATNAVAKIAAGTSTITYIGTGLFEPSGVAVDAAGNVYVGDYGNNAVKMIPSGSNTPVTIGTGFNGPSGVAVDAAGDVFVADFNNNAVKEIKVGGTIVTLGSGFNHPFSVAVDGAGNVYVADALNGELKEIPAGSNTPVILAQSSFIDPYGVAVDAEGDLFVADRRGSVKEIVSGSTTPVPVGSGFSAPDGVATDGQGNVYVADVTANNITKVTPAGGYYITPQLPTGLSFNGTTGAITGKPTVLSAAANYTITAYNYAGSTSAAINLKVISADATLSALNLITGTISPAFSPTTTSYTATVSNATTEISVQPTLNFPGASMTVDGDYVPSGTVSDGIPLNDGPNTITIVVTAEDGVTKKTYTIVVTRISNIATLSDIVMSKGSLSPSFASGTTTYYDMVSNGNASVTLTPTSSDPNATITVNGTAVKSGAASGAIALSVGSNTITTVVTAQDGVTTDTYTVNVTRPTTNAKLSALALITATLSPAFNTNTTSYTATVPYTTDNISVQPTAASSLATLTVDGYNLPSGAVSDGIELSVGANTIPVVVTAQDGVTTDTYTITVTRSAPVVTLSALKLITGTLSPAFSPNTASYTSTVSNATTDISVQPTLTDPNATMTVQGYALGSGTVSDGIALNDGKNTITIVVTGVDGVTTKTYTIVVTRISNIATLSNITLSRGTLSPAFATATNSYTDMVANGNASVTLTPTATDPGATITVNGTAVKSGAASGAIALSVGANAVTVVVTAQDGVTTDTYSVNVIRPSTNAKLASLTISNGTLTPVFNENTTSYTVDETNTVSSVTVTPTAAVTGSTITVDGDNSPSGTVSDGIPLNVGSNTITIVVTAQDGVTTGTYTITVTRNVVGMNSRYEPVSVSSPLNGPQPADDGIIIHQGVTPNGDGIDDFFRIDNIANYPDNKLTIMNRNGVLVYEAKSYDNATRVFDGHSSKNGQMQLPGTYFYQLDYTVDGVVKHKTGFLVLKY